MALSFASNKPMEIRKYRLDSMGNEQAGVRYEVIYVKIITIKMED